jgi:signal transduction histidine kinase
MHVDLFLLIVIVTLYADWLPFLLTIGYAVVEEIVVALTNPASIAEVPYFASQPWLWGGLQAGIVLAAATAGLIHWRIDEAAHGDEAAMARAAEQDRLIEAERQARATTEQALRAREELLSIVAHELKDPLGAIKGKAQLLQRQTATREDRLRDGLELIDTSATRMAELLDVLQDVTRLATGDVPALQPEMTDVVAIARRVVAEFQKTSPPHRLRLLAPEPSLIGCWDPTRLERAIANLVLQAIMSTPAGGFVDIRVEHVASLDVPFATIAVTTDPSGLPSVLPLVSLKGVQHVASSVAPDIGIIVARQIIEQHGGYLDGPIDIAGRSVVTVRLPIQPPTRDDGCHIPVACFV